MAESAPAPAPEPAPQSAEAAASAAEAEITQPAADPAPVAAPATPADTGLKRDPSTGQFLSFRSFATKDDLKKHAERYNSLDDLLQGNLEMRTKLSSAIIKPGKDAKPEDTAAYYKALGVPETADGYKYVPPKELETEFSAPEAQERLKSFSAVAHKAGINAEAYKAIIDWRNAEIVKDQQAVIAADKKFADDADAMLKKQWGADYPRNLEFANRGAEHALGEQFLTAKQIQMKDGRYLMDNPIMVEAFAKIGRMMSEDGLGPVPMSDADRTGLRAQLETLVEQQAEARMNGKDNEAKRIEGEIQKMASRISGDREYKGPDLT